MELPSHCEFPRRLLSLGLAGNDACWTPDEGIEHLFTSGASRIPFHLTRGVCARASCLLSFLPSSCRPFRSSSVALPMSIF
jgi:hypothetical protein